MKFACVPTEWNGSAGARFQYLLANATRMTGEGRRAAILPATAVRLVDGVKIGFIGETLQAAREMVTPAGVRGLVFRDVVTTANRQAAELQRQGVRAIVLLMHDGGEQNVAGGEEDPNGCTNLNGPIVSIAHGLVPAIRVVISGHTHASYNWHHRRAHGDERDFLRPDDHAHSARRRPAERLDRGGGRAQ